MKVNIPQGWIYLIILFVFFFLMIQITSFSLDLKGFVLGLF
jgi:hypothetical protein